MSIRNVIEAKKENKIDIFYENTGSPVAGAALKLLAGENEVCLD